VTVHVNHVGQLGDQQRSEVLRIVRITAEADKVVPLSEQVLLAVRQEHHADSSEPLARSVHFLAYAERHLAGYAHLEPTNGKGSTAEMMTDPSHRRAGVATALIRDLEQALEPQAEDLRLWSHGDLASARAFATRNGYGRVRELWQMRRPLRPAVSSLPPVLVPEGFKTRHFVVGRDEQAWLRVNARAFVDHPEQGRLTRHDLDQRIAEPWFDPQGFILIEDIRDPHAVLAASHWTKVVGGQDPRTSTGEVYVVGVDPAYQGRGLGRTATILGLAHLRQKGLTEAMLYVDADNRAALATYRGLDFDRSGVDIMYSRIVHSPM
jgi:mycothiol synthase